MKKFKNLLLVFFIFLINSNILLAKNQTGWVVPEPKRIRISTSLETLATILKKRREEEAFLKKEIAKFKEPEIPVKKEIPVKAEMDGFGEPEIPIKRAMDGFGKPETPVKEAVEHFCVICQETVPSQDTITLECPCNTHMCQSHIDQQIKAYSKEEQIDRFEIGQPHVASYRKLYQAFLE